MSEQLPDNSNIQKRIKQLENQNIKFRSLLKNAIDVSQKESYGISKLQEEAEYLKKTIENLEKEKTQLEIELNAVIEGSYHNEMQRTVSKLEDEHLELQAKLHEVLKEIDRENLEIESLRAEDRQLKEILVALEKEKMRLLEDIENLESTEGGAQSPRSIALYEKLSELEDRKANLTKSLQVSESQLSSPSDDVLSNFKTLEDTYKQYVEALQEQTSLKEKVSELEEKTEELIKIVQKTESKDTRMQTKLNEAVIKSNSNLLQKISIVTSKLLSNLELNSDFMQTIESPEQLEAKMSYLEREKNSLYDDLERTLEESAYEVSQLSEGISDAEIKRLINEVEIQKAVLLCSLKSLKLKVESSDSPSCDTQLPSIPESVLEMPYDERQTVPITSGLHKLLDSREESEVLDNKSTYEVYEDEHKKLEAEIIKLEQEKELLLMQLQSVSATSSQRPEGSGTRNEQQLQTQSELHSTFMNEESSHEVLSAPNYDDATNQLYADEEARLEQRIRELEAENARIKRELDSILTEIKNDKSEMSELQVTGEMLRQRIEELENQSKTVTELQKK